MRCTCGSPYRLPDARERYTCHDCGKRLPAESAVLLVDLAAGAQLPQGAGPEDPAEEPEADHPPEPDEGTLDPPEQTAPETPDEPEPAPEPERKVLRGVNRRRSRS